MCRSLHSSRVGEPGRRLLYRGLCEMKGGQVGHLSPGISFRGTWREGFFTGDNKGYAK